MNFRETTKEDLDFVADNSVSRGISKRQPERIEYSYTLEHEGKVLGIGAFRLINATTAWIWCDITHLAANHMIVVYRVMKEWTEIFVKEHGIRRLQAYIELDFPEAIRMITHLGYHRESIMKHFIEDKDAYLYVRFF